MSSDTFDEYMFLLEGRLSLKVIPSFAFMVHRLSFAHVAKSKGHPKQVMASSDIHLQNLFLNQLDEAAPLNSGKMLCDV